MAARTQNQSPRRQNQSPRGQNQSPRGPRGGGNANNFNNRQQQGKNKIFEPYWSKQTVSDGIKRGQLLVGPIRINKKNYEDAYVPLPDGKGDLYISGMPDRNRALNGDVVVVLPNGYDKWRVYKESFEDFEKAKTKEAKINSGEVDTGMESDDSGPDVIFESSDDEGVAAGVDKLTLGGDANQASPRTPQKKDSKSSTPQRNKDGTLKNGSQGSGSVNRQNQKKFTSVSDMLQSGSPLAQDLFGAGAKSAPAAGATLDKDSFVQQTGKVVFISEANHSRAASGRLKLMPDKNRNLALFAPMDSRVPRIVIAMADCPKDFFERSEDYATTLFIARITQWDEGSRMPKGSLAKSLGEAGQIEPETEAMLLEHEVEDLPFTEEVLACLPKCETPWTIPESEIKARRDFRPQCVFTIDPATARDLDDAVSIEELGDGMYEVGVHIADVSYFVQEDSALDESAASRATSVYLVQKVVPMLPRLLCEELCSLNPDTDRLTFSVLWKINEDGEIFDEWYGRSVIRSCAKLAYDHAQGFIDQPDKEWTQEELPPITNNFSIADVKKKTLLLQKIACSLRQQRFDNGALRLDQVKLMYVLNKETGLPVGYSVYKQKDANRLIEEFMLLANMAVAHKIKLAFPDHAVLRRHPAPQNKPLDDLSELCKGMGLDIDTSSSGRIHRSLAKYYGDEEAAQAKLKVLVLLISKPMQHARYFCAGVIPDETEYHHYALNVPLYTHFTSPIRRYPDIMVHRLLGRSLGYAPPPDKSQETLQSQADKCNVKKENAKACSERSSDIYFSLFVKEAGPLEEQGMVMAVLDKSFDVLILSLGVTKRVYLERQKEVMKYKFRKVHKKPELFIEWAADESCDHRTRHKITLFTNVECVVFADEGILQWSCLIRRPKDEIKTVKSLD